MARIANVLLAHGVKKGDRVCIYLPMIPELAYAMLACARIGAVHSVVFAGFSADSLRDRILDAGCKLVVTANEGLRGGKRIPLKATVDQAVEGLVARRDACSSSAAPTAEVPMQDGPRPLARGGDGQAALDLPGRVDGVGGPAVHPLHLGLAPGSPRACSTRPAATSSTPR